MSSLVHRKKASKALEAPVNLNGKVEVDSSSKFKDKPPQFRNQKVFIRVVVSLSVFIIAYFTSSRTKSTILAGVNELLPLREHKVDCTTESYPSDMHPSCLQSHCGRFATDNVITETELLKLKALSINAFNKLFKEDSDLSLTVDFNSKSLEKHESLKKSIDEVLKALHPKLVDTLSQRFRISHDSLYLTSPAFVSRITNVTTEHSETIHNLHDDSIPNSSNDSRSRYSLIIFLSTLKKDYTGGKFFIEDSENGKKKNVIVEGKAGRIIGYNAGSENLYYLEKVSTGANYFMKLSFSCDKSKAEFGV